MARMSIDDKFMRDPRVVKLGRRFGWSRRETMGALLDVFAIAYDREIDVLAIDEVDVAADQAGFANGMVAERLAEDHDGEVRIKGAAERIEYLAKKVEAGRKGGLKSAETRRKKGEAKRSSASPKPEAIGNPPDPVPDLPPDPVPDLPPDPRSESTLTRDPAVLSPLVYNQENPQARRRLAESVYEKISNASIAIAAEIGLPTPLPFPVISPSMRAASFRDLLDRVREEGPTAPIVCEAVIKHLTEQARATRSIEWLAEKSFTAGAWRTARRGGSTTRAGPKTSTARPTPLQNLLDDIAEREAAGET